MIGPKGKTIRSIQEQTGAQITSGGFPISTGFGETSLTAVDGRRSIDEIIETLLIAAFLVILTVFIFLQDWRSTLVPSIAIPVSLIGTFAAMAAMGVSLNTVSLLALVLAIGVVVDDAIVVGENVYTHRQLGKKFVEAAVDGTYEVLPSVIASVK